MGAKQATPANFDKKELQRVEELKLVSNFSDKEVARLIKIFNELDLDRGGTISKDELFNLKAFRANPFLSRIIQIAQSDKRKRAVAHKGSTGVESPVVREQQQPELSDHPEFGPDAEDDEDEGTLDIKEFASLMSVFSIRASREQKLRYAFRIYDCDEDGKIGKEDLQQTLGVISGDKMEPEFLLTVVDQVFEEADSDRDGYIEFDDFAKVVMNTDIEGKLTFDF